MKINRKPKISKVASSLSEHNKDQRPIINKETLLVRNLKAIGKLKLGKAVVLKPEQTVEIWHSQSAKQSINYQSMDAAFGAKMTVRDTPKSIRRGIRHLEQIIEPMLIKKMGEQRRVLEKL